MSKDSFSDEYIHKLLQTHYQNHYRQRRSSIPSIEKTKLMTKVYAIHHRKQHLKHISIGTLIAAALLGASLFLPTFFEQQANIEKNIKIID